MAGLQEFHHFDDKPNKTLKIVKWIALALLLGGAAFYVVDSGMLRSHPRQAGQPYPRGL